MNALFREQLFIKIILELKLYSLKFGMKLKRSKIQSFALNHGRKGKELLRKYSYRGRNGMLHYVHKFVNKLLGMYSLTMFTVEKLNKKRCSKMRAIDCLRGFQGLCGGVFTAF